MGLTIEYAGKSDLGCVRTNNEDNFGYDARYGVFVVCDGMGGAAAGEVASKLAVDTVLNYFRDAANGGPYPAAGASLPHTSERSQAVFWAIQQANRAILATGAKHIEQSGMGSTIAVALIHQSQLTIGHVGDSRIYLIRRGTIKQLTHDHSLVMEQVRRGLISKEEAEHSDLQNIIIRALGCDEGVEPDLADCIAMPDDILLLASDGLTKNVPDEQIRTLIEGAAALDQACDALILAAKKKGGDDNITCVLIKTVNQPWYRRISDQLFSGGGKPRWQDSF